MRGTIIVVGIDPATKKEARVVGTKEGRWIVVRGQKCQDLWGTLVSKSGPVLTNFRTEEYTHAMAKEG